MRNIGCLLWHPIPSTRSFQANRNRIGAIFVIVYSNGLRSAALILSCVSDRTKIDCLIPLVLTACIEGLLTCGQASSYLPLL